MQKAATAIRPTFPIHTRDLSSIAKTNPVFSYPSAGYSKCLGYPVFETPRLSPKSSQLPRETPLVLPERAQENLHTTDFLCFFGKINTEETAASKKYAYLSLSICFVRQIVRHWVALPLARLQATRPTIRHTAPHIMPAVSAPTHERPQPRSTNTPSPSQL